MRIGKIVRVCFRMVALLMAVLVAFSVSLPTAQAAPDSLIQAAIDSGLAWLANQQNANGSWGFTETVGKTGLAIKELAHDAVVKGYSSPFDPSYPYREVFQEGIDYLFRNASTVPISMQAHGDPDTDGDGIAVRFAGGETYETAIALMAISETNTPNREVDVIGSSVDGWTYYEVAEDIMNWLAFAQVDVGNTEGGWGYVANSGSADQSNSGYATLGLGFVEASSPYGFGVSVPQFVKDELGDPGLFIDYIQNDVGVGDPQYDGGSGCYVPNDPSPDCNILETGNLLFEMAWYGDPLGSKRVQDAIDYIVRAWTKPGVPIGYWWSAYQGWHGNYHAMFTMMKGLEAFGIEVIGGIDWFEEVSDSIVATQNANGSWGPDYWDDWAGGDAILSTTWALLTLQKATPRFKVGIPDQCVLAGDVFQPFDADTCVIQGTPPDEWKWSGQDAVTVTKNAANVFTIAYAPGWTGSSQ